MKRFRIVGLLIGIGLVLALLSYAGIPEILAVLKTVQPLFLVAAALLYIPSLFFRTVRWRILLGTRAFTEVFHTLNVGNFVNRILPYKLGGVLRAALMGQKVGTVKSFSSVVLDNIIEILFVVLTCGLAIAFVPSGAEEIQKMIMIVLGVSAAVLVCIAVLIKILHSPWLQKTFSKWKKTKKTTQMTSKQIAQELTAYVNYTRPKILLLAFIYTAGVWLFTALANLFLIAALDIHLGLLYVYIISTLPIIIGIISLIPGGYGVQEASILGILSFAGVSVPEATAIALLIRLLDLFMVSLAGLWGMDQLKLRTTFTSI